MAKKIIIGVLIVVVALSIAKDKVIEVSVEQVCEAVLGTKLEIGSMKVGIIRPVLSIKDMKLYNPEGYKDEIMADIPEIYLDYDLAAILQNKVNIKEFRFYLKEFDVIKNENGELNVNSLKAVESKEGGEELEKQEKEKGEMPEIYIGKLSLRADNVLYKDYSKGGEPEVKTFNIGLNEQYSDIKDPYTLVRLILVSVLQKTAIGNLVNVPMEGVDEAMATAVDMGQQAQKAAMETMTKTTAEAENTAKEASKAIGGFMSGLGGSKEK